MNTYFIAEIGSNHNHDINRAKKLIETAKDSGFNAIKFQAFKADKLYADIPQNKEKIKQTKKWELPREWIPELFYYTKRLNLDFGLSIFDFGCFLIQEINYFDFLKIGSYEILRYYLIKTCCETKAKKIIISTGLANMREIQDSYEIIKDKRYHDNRILMHCVGNYPTSYQDADLLKIKELDENFNCIIGYSDHTTNEGVIYKSIVLGAQYIEMHIDLIDMQGWESSIGHCWSLLRAKQVIHNIRDGEIASQAIINADNHLRQYRTDPKDGLRPLKEIRND